MHTSQSATIRTLFILFACALFGAMLVSASVLPAYVGELPALQATAESGKGKLTPEAGSSAQAAPTIAPPAASFAPVLLAQLNADYSSNFVWNPDGRTIFTHGPVDGLMAHRVEQLTLPRPLATWEESAFSMDVAPGGLALALGSRDKVLIHDARTGELTTTLVGPSSFVYGVRYSPDGLMLAAIDATGQLSLWDSMSETLLAQLQVDGYAGYGVLFSPDGQQMITAGIEGDIKIWATADLLEDSSSAQPLRILPGESFSFVFSLEISPDGQTLAAGMNDGQVILWEIASGEPMARLEGHTGDVGAVTFSPDGRLLASGSDDEIVQVWDLETLEPIATLRQHHDSIIHIEFSPFGLYLVTQDSGGTTLLWGEEEA